MKDRSSLSGTLGLSQHEIALLLGISRSQWSMFVSGKRNLPLTAKKKLMAILIYLQQLKEKDIFNTKKLLQTDQRKNGELVLQRKLERLRYEQLLLEKKIAVSEQKRAKNLAALHVIRFLEMQKKDPASLLKNIRDKVERNLATENIRRLDRLRLRLEAVITLQNIIQGKM
ncbi:hypothetical protein DI487_00725 [Flavobacterium sediminis]|uniref:Uncharacterized protein n=1 Tax=Flavobacterium sediminis TaxID=2201181 RepID=A0A2U8QR12_9FLAO|nr:hypothetical protein [Flavobacterium sediminis]AWM12537.1 hypothetical protein DI487_00725 [Flavobacterium sediminis]